MAQHGLVIPNTMIIRNFTEFLVLYLFFAECCNTIYKKNMTVTLSMNPFISGYLEA